MLLDFDQKDRGIQLRLFKFYPNHKYHVKAFNDNQVFLTFPSRLNDVFDTSERLIDPFPQFKQQISWNEQQQVKFNKHGICSFIESSDIKKDRMWAFYANSFNGFALEFDPERLNASSPPPLHLMPVSYMKEPLNLDNQEQEVRVNGDTFKISEIRDNIKYQDRVFQCLHIVKSEVWREENEWRLVLAENKPESIIPHSAGYYLPIEQRAFLRLYLGWRLAEETKKRLLKIAELKGVPVSIVTPMIINGKWDMAITNL